MEEELDHLEKQSGGTTAVMEAVEAYNGPKDQILYGLLCTSIKLLGRHLPSAYLHIKTLMTAVLKWLFGTIHLFLARLVTQWKQSDGSLMLADISLWFWVLFLHLNCGKMESTIMNMDKTEGDYSWKAFVES